MPENKDSLSRFGRELLPHAARDGIKELFKLWFVPLLGMILAFTVGIWRAATHLPTHWYILSAMFAVCLVCFVVAIRKRDQEKLESPPAFKAYVEDFQYGVRMLWLDKTFLFLECRLVSPHKTTSITAIEPTVFGGGKQWAASLIEDLSEWFLTHDMGGDEDLEGLSLWKKLKESPLQKEVQTQGWMGIAINAHLSMEELGSINRIDLSIEDGGGKKQIIPIPIQAKPGKMIVAKHLRRPY